MERHTDKRWTQAVRPPRAGYKLMECDGEAHSNPYIDHCLRCAPRWGWIEVPSTQPQSHEDAVLEAIRPFKGLNHNDKGPGDS